LPLIGAMDRSATAAVPNWATEDWSAERLYANGIWIAFVAVQAIDGMFTYVGMHLHGIVAEANPLIAWSAASYGIGASVVSAKLFAAACGVILHLTERHQALALLSLAYMAAAIWPWTLLLWP
jgi:hypothetical protein